MRLETKNINRTRFKLTIVTLVFLKIVTFYSIHKNMESVAAASVAGILTILSTYIWGETRRPSKSDE